MVNYSVIGGKPSQDLAKKVARKLKANYVKTELRIFPDGEGKITLKSEPKKGKIIVVQSIYPPVDSNLIQALSLITKARQYSSDVIFVVPYLGYARQDREFLPGEIVTMKVIAKLFKAAGVKKLIVVDIHSMIGLKLFRFPVKNITAVPELVKFFKKKKLRKPLVVSPDLGGKDRAGEFARIYGSDFIVLNKKRDRKTGKVKILSSGLESIKGRDLILVDDMISTGGSIIKAAEFLKKQGCGRVFVVCTHALLVNDAEKKIKNAGVTRIVSSNTIPKTTALVDVSSIIAKAIT